MPWQKFPFISSPERASPLPASHRLDRRLELGSSHSTTAHGAPAVVVTQALPLVAISRPRSKVRCLMFALYLGYLGYLIYPWDS